MQTVMGGETEYAISGRAVGGQPVPQHALLGRFFAHATDTLGYASTSSRGRFLRNGGLLYLDAGLHMEWATPETTSPFEVVRYLAAGDQILGQVAASLQAASVDIAEVFCSRSNVDYLSGTLWAAHESYMHRADVLAVQNELVPFLASRVILGAGGWDNQAPGLRFTMSPRAHFINVLADRDSQYVRPLFHTKDEPHSRLGTHRLHVACGESLCSQTANVLRFGTTALVLALVERGIRPGTEVTLADPVLAVRTLAADPDLRTAVPLVSGRSMTALALQCHYLERVEGNLSDIPYPWAADLCTLWRRTLQDLAAGGSHAQLSLDWAIKRRLFTRCLEQRGVSWASLPAWDALLRRLKRRWTVDFGEEPPFVVGDLLEPTLWMKIAMDRLRPSAARRGLSWDQLPALLAARQEVFELDAKFGALGETGVFNALDRAGALRHVVRHLDVADAVANPPSDTRARIRGEVVRRLSAEGIPYGADWTSIFDKGRQRELDLSNPFEGEERWRQVPAAEDRLAERLAERLREPAPGAGPAAQP